MRFLLVLVLLSPAFAQPLDALLAEALRNNREILAAQKKYEAARQRPSQAGALPDPTLSLGYTSVGGPWPGAGLGREQSANAGVMVSQEVPFPGKQKIRTEIASAEASAEYQDYLAARLSVVSRLKQAYHRLHHAQVSIDFTKRYQALLQNILRIAEARYSTGSALQQDVFKAQTQFAIFETQLIRFEQERTTTEQEINALLNRATRAHIEAPTEMPLGNITAPLDTLLEHARTQAPALARERSMTQRADLAASLARRDYYPDYTVSGGYFNQGGMPPMWQLRVDVKVPVFFWKKQHAAVTEMEFGRSEARRNFEAADVGVESTIRNDYTMATTARRLADLYERSVIPAARLTLESSMTTYETGSSDFISLYTNFMSLVDYELMYHEQVMNFHVAIARLEETTGMENLL
jgi:outer membrane protein TolC